MGLSEVYGSIHLAPFTYGRQGEKKLFGWHNMPSEARNIDAFPAEILAMLHYIL